MKESSRGSSSRNDPMVHNALGSASAGIVARLLTHPLDTAKARIQAQKSTFRGPLDALTRTYARERIAGLYRGFGAVIVGGTPGTVLYLCSYEIFKDRLGSIVLRQERTDVDGMTAMAAEFGVHFGSGMLAETIACVIYVPVDVIKERLQVQGAVPTSSAMLYRNSWDALKQIAQNEGLSGVYRGYGATLASFGPFSALYFVFYERFKAASRTKLRTVEASVADVQISFPYLVLCTSSAGALSSWLTSPLDMAKLRLQIQRGGVAGDRLGTTQIMYRGVVDCLQTAYRQDGVRGLFRGAGARVLHFAPATTVTMTCYETFRSFFARTLSTQ